MASTASRIGRVAALLALVVLVGVPRAATAGRPLASRRACRVACTQLIELCHQAGAKRRFCRRNVLRHCRHTGVVYCHVDGFPTSTTITPGTTTTSTTLDSGPTVHGCNRVEAQDHRGEALVTVEFTAFDYAPECILVSTGASVRFSGSFSTFPLIGGEFPNDDPASPFSPATRSGFSKTFVMTHAGLFPYHSEDAWVTLFRMWGAVIVD